jgi:Protein of unknown function (DUF1360)
MRPHPSSGADRPLGAYAALMGAYAALVAGFTAWLRRSERDLPERPSVADIALLTVATHKASRLLAKERVTAAVRAPFTEIDVRAGVDASAERASGEGLRRALGELLGCPRCLSLWIATSFMAGLIAAPRATRWVAAGLAAVFGSDLLHIAYRRVRDRGDG